MPVLKYSTHGITVIEVYSPFAIKHIVLKFTYIFRLICGDKSAGSLKFTRYEVTLITATIFVSK